MSTMIQPLTPKNLVVEVDSKPANQQNLHMFKSALFVDIVWRAWMGGFSRHSTWSEDCLSFNSV